MIEKESDSLLHLFDPYNVLSVQVIHAEYAVKVVA